jgi:outer membrane protein assembly factor BamB
MKNGIIPKIFVCFFATLLFVPQLLLAQTTSGKINLIYITPKLNNAPIVVEGKTYSSSQTIYNQVYHLSSADGFFVYKYWLI